MCVARLVLARLTSSSAGVHSRVITEGGICRTFFSSSSSVRTVLVTTTASSSSSAPLQRLSSPTRFAKANFGTSDSGERNDEDRDNNLSSSASNNNVNGRFSAEQLLARLPSKPFPPEVREKLLAPLDPEDVEIKPDGMIYLPEIKYRRILNLAFGPGGWVMVPLSGPVSKGRSIEREYALFVYGSYISQAMGDHTFYMDSPMSVLNEAAKSKAVMRVCKDIGVGSELWDPKFIETWKSKYAVEVWAENKRTKEKRKFWKRKDRPLDSQWNVLNTVGQLQQQQQPQQPQQSSDKTTSNNNSTTATPKGLFFTAPKSGV